MTVKSLKLLGSHVTRLNAFTSFSSQEANYRTGLPESLVFGGSILGAEIVESKGVAEDR